jgi:hypothetical protein
MQSNTTTMDRGPRSACRALTHSALTPTAKPVSHATPHTTSCRGEVLASLRKRLAHAGGTTKTLTPSVSAGSAGVRP